MSITPPIMRGEMMSGKVIYSDRLVELTEDSILLRNYYFPFGSKRVPFLEIEDVFLYKPTLWSGKYRIYGTGDFRTWFPLDGNRASCDRIFVLRPKGKWWRMGFTSENSVMVERVLREKGLSVLECQ